MSTGSLKKKIKVPVLLGPTACGKSDIAIRLAQDLNLDIISCDSRQIYRGMDIGTAKPGSDLRQAVCHWLVDIVDPDETYSGFQFRHDASEVLCSLNDKGKRALICGGTGFYYRCLSRGIGPQIASDPEFRRMIEEKIRLNGAESVHAELAGVDPAAAARIHPNDSQRMIRALEVYQVSKLQMSGLYEKTQAPGEFEFLELAITRPREQLYQRINDRVDAMAAAGLWDEFLALRKKGFDEKTPGMMCVGYRELFAVEQGKISLESALEKVKQNTRRYAKRQMTWFRTQTSAHQLDVSDFSSYEKIFRYVHDFLQQPERA